MVREWNPLDLDFHSNNEPEPVPDIAGRDIYPVYKDPFLGKCIHGTDGVKYKQGLQVNPDCKECVASGRG